jgi:hypothetical protein
VAQLNGAENEKVEIEKPKVASMRIRADSPPLANAKPKKDTNFETKIWPIVLEQIKGEKLPLYSALHLARPHLEGSELVLAFQFSLHQKKVSDIKSLSKLADVIERLSGDKLKISCVVDKTAKDKATLGDIATINNIFGPAEVLES